MAIARNVKMAAQVVSADEVKVTASELVASKIFVVDVARKVFEERRLGTDDPVREEVNSYRINLYISVRDLPDNDIASIYALASRWIESKNSDLVECSILGVTVMSDQPYQQYFMSL